MFFTSIPRFSRFSLIAIFFACAAHAGSARADEECDGIRKAYDAANADRTSLYGMAYCAGRENRADEAFSYLFLAIERGFHAVAHLSGDPDFKGLHGDPRWKQALLATLAADKKYREKVNAELLQIFTADQADRTTGEIDWKVVSVRDAERSKRVAAIMAAGGAVEADDYYHAAMVYQHGDTPQSYEQARAWALRAATLDPQHRNASWLACAAEDRYLQSIGKPQIWGTQYRKKDATSPWTLEPIVRTAKTDAERKAMWVPSLAEAEKRLVEMNK